MAHNTVFGPFRKTDFTNQLRLHPANGSVGHGLGHKRADLLNQRSQLRADLLKSLPAETCAHVANIDKFLPFKGSQQKSAEMLAPSSGESESADDCVPPLLSLDL
jgi:hypothetical protein